MRKVLLTVMMVSSLLAFNACKKDGATGPAGPAGPTGATGAAGPAGAVGAAGAKGADGTKILTGTAVPNAEGAVGDYYLQKSGTSTVLWGPKVAAGWAGTNVTLNGAAGATGATGADGATGATGATGAVGAAGTQFLAGAGAPADATGVNGDFYFDTTNSVFYGPKMAGTWTGTNTMSLGTAFSPKRYTILRGFESVTELTTGAPAVSVREYGEDLLPTWANFDIFTSYAVTANDMIRINQYPGWGDDREMIFQSDPTNAPGVFDAVPTASSELGAGGFAWFQVGAKFRYSRNKTNPMTEFTLTQADIDRLKDNGGLAFGYLTYAKALPSSVALGQNLVFARTKNVQVKKSTTNFSTRYSALTKFNLNNIANFDKYRQEGKVYVKYKYYTQKTGAAAVNNVPVLHPSVGGAGWIDLTTYANSYVGASGAGSYGTPGLTDQNPFTLDGLAANFMTSGSPLGTAGVPVVLAGAAGNQVAVANTVVGGANPTTFSRGNVIINWTITSGSNFGAAPANTIVGPTTLDNTGGELDPVTVAFNNPTPATASFVARGFETTYYSSPALTATNDAGTAITLGGVAPNQTVPQLVRVGGQEASYFSNINNLKLVQIQVVLIPTQDLGSAKAKGVNVENVDEVVKFFKL